MKLPKIFDSNTRPVSETKSTNSTESSERSPDPADVSKSNGFGSGRVVLFLLVAAAYTPLRGYLGNIDKFPHPERLAMIVLAYLALALGWFVLFERVGFKREASLVSSLAFVLLASSGGSLAASTSTLIGFLIWLGLAIACALLVNRVPGGLGAFIALGAFAFLAVGLILSWSVTERPTQSMGQTVSSSMPSTLNVHPDVFLVLLDGFPGNRAVQEVYDSSLEFTESGGILRHEAWSSYPMTIASVASLLDMGYPLGDGDVVDAGSSGPLAQVMAGDNRFTRILDQNGYQVTYVESGYSRSYCAEIVDHCIESAFLDEGTHWILAQSILGMRLRERTGSAFTQGALHTMDWLGDHVEAFADNDRPDFVFANVLAPHPPLFLDAECNVVVEYWRVGNSVYAGDEIVEERQNAFIDQSECVADFEDRFLMAVSDDSVVIFVSDHGGDSLGQMSEADRIWDQADIVERLNVHFAVRTSLGCAFGQEVLLTEVLRDVLWCLAGGEPSSRHLDARLFTASRIEGTTDFELEELTPEELDSVGVSGG
jgi:hypothetical protein